MIYIREKAPPRFDLLQHASDEWRTDYNLEQTK